MMRSVAITGSTDYINAWFADRQGGRWAEQTVRSAFPGVTSHGPMDRAMRLQELTELHRRGVVSDAEFERLRARLRL
jgi:hypothetical protein